MVRGLILYYLNIKPTHGYEIQQFLSISGIDQWSDIKSGSIYYALAKLEKEGNITEQREERTGSRIRKIYEITDKGLQTLVSEMKQELKSPLFEIGSAKFVISPILASVSQSEAEEIITEHIKDLQKTKEFWSFWGNKKPQNEKYLLTQLSFQIATDSIDKQIEWHEELLKHLPYYMEESKQMGKMIAAFDFNQTENTHTSEQQNSQVEMLEYIKKSLEDNPEQVMDQINALIKQMKQ